MTQNELYLSKVNQANECTLKIVDTYLLEFMEEQLYYLEDKINKDCDKLKLPKIKKFINDIDYLLGDYEDSLGLGFRI